MCSWTGRQRDVDGQPPSKQPHLNPADIDETDFSMAGLTRGVVVEVGTLDPVKDYVTLLDKDDGSGFENSELIHPTTSVFTYFL